MNGTNRKKRIRNWIKASWLRGILAFLCAVAILTGSAYSLAQTSVADRFSEDDMIADPGGGDHLDVEPVENYHFVDESEYAGVLLRKTDDAGKEYINETLFIGDSNTLRMNMYGFLTLDNCIGVESLGITGAKKNACVYFEGYSSPVTIAEAVGLMKPRRIIVSFGTNDIAGLATDTFISNYRTFLLGLQKAYSYTDIVIAAVPPFAKAVENSSFSINTVNDYNKALIALAKEMGLVFLDSGEAFTGTDGYIKPEYIYSDGIHITDKGFEAFFKYVRTHSHIVEDTRPQPIGKIPKQKAAPKPPAKPDQLFDCGAAAAYALNMLIGYGFTAATTTSNMTGAEYLYFSVPFAQATAGAENTIASNLYQSVISRTTKTTGVVAISYAIDEAAEMYTFTVSIAPKTCAQHTWNDWNITLEPTCAAAGIETRECKICGEKESRTIPAKGHDFAILIERVEATETTAGYTKHKCSRCQEIKTTELPALGPPAVPAPGPAPLI